MSEQQVEQAVEQFLVELRSGTRPSIDSFCGRWPEQATELRPLLLAAKLVEGAKRHAMLELSEADSPVPRVPERLDMYRIVSEIGRGGMGVVYRAEDEVLRRHVALKVISPKYLSRWGDVEDRIARFETEARIAARLQHSNIVQIYGFSQDQGTHYLAMQLIDGLPLDSLWDQLRSGGKADASDQATRAATPETRTAAWDLTWSLIHDAQGDASSSTTFDPAAAGDREDRGDVVATHASAVGSAQVKQLQEATHRRPYWLAIARIGDQVAGALQYSHEKGVTHRDIKPGNLLLDSSGVVWVADFGLAREVAPDQSMPAAFEGSLRYMAPEQFRGQADARSDIYSLGVTLYELLALQPAFQASSVADLQSAVARQELTVPWRQLRLPADLEAVIRRAMSVEPGERYASAAELQEDLRRFQNGEPVRARRPGVMERSARWCRRHPARASATGLVLAVCMLSAVLAIVSNVAARTQSALRTDADRQRHMAQLRQTQLEYDAMIRSSALRPATDQFNLQSGRDSNKPRGAGVPEALRSWETRWLSELSKRGPRLFARFCEGDWSLLDAQLAPDGKRLLTADASGLLLIWDLDTGRVTKRLHEGRLQPAPERWAHHLFGRPAGSDTTQWGICCVGVRWIAPDHFVAASYDGGAWVFDARDGSRRELFRAANPLTCLAMQGRQVLFGDQRGALHLADLDAEPPSEPMHVAREEQPSSPNQAEVMSVASAPWLPGWVVGYADGVVTLLNDQLQTVQSLRFNAPIWSVDASPSRITRRPSREVMAPMVAVGCGDSAIQWMRWSDALGALETQPTLRANSATVPKGIHLVRFSADGDRLLAADDQGYLSEIDLFESTTEWNFDASVSDKRFRLLREHLGGPLPLLFQRQVSSILALNDRRTIVTAGQDAVAKVWRIESPDGGLRELQTSAGPNPRIAFDPSLPELLWAVDELGNVRLVDVDADRELATRAAHDSPAAGDLAAGRARLSARSVEIAVARQSQLVATVGGDRFVRLWSAAGRRIRPAAAKKLEHDAPLISVALSHDGRFAAAVDHQARLSLWNTESGRRTHLESISESNERPLTGCVAFSPDGENLLAFGAGQTGRIYALNPVRRLKLEASMAGGGGTAAIWNPVHPLQVVTSDDYPRYTSAALDPSLRTQRLPVIRQEPCVTMEATPDSRRLVFLELGGRVVFVEPRELQPTLEMLMPSRRDADLTVDALGQRLVVAGADGAMDLLVAPLDKQMPTAKAKDNIRPWRHATVLAPRNETLQLDDRMIRMDGRGRLHMLAIYTRPEDESREGALYYVRYDPQTDEKIRERIEIGDPQYDRQFSPRALALALVDNDQPRIVARRRLEGYDGEVWEGERQGPDAWRFRKLLGQQNWGFYPSPQYAADGSLQELLHFNFHGFVLLRSQPPTKDAPDDFWSASPLGRQGDGLYLECQTTADGVRHLLFRRNIFNSAPVPQLYARFDGQNWSSEVVDPFAANVRSLGIDSEGRVVVMRLGPDRKVFLRREADRWVDLCEMPEATTVNGPPSYVFMPDGDIVAGPIWNESERTLQLWRRHAERWELETFADEVQGELSYQKLILDGRGRLRVLVGDDTHGLRIFWPAK
ncbi:MAG: protein kinase [Planctomycetales bacterium]|nr:protein kinase [Planctomycetales bacterium]